MYGFVDVTNANQPPSWLCVNMYLFKHVFGDLCDRDFMEVTMEKTNYILHYLLPLIGKANPALRSFLEQFGSHVVINIMLTADRTTDYFYNNVDILWFKSFELTLNCWSKRTWTVLDNRYRNPVLNTDWKCTQL